MDVGHQRFGRNFFDLHNQKIGAGHLIPEESITTLEMAIQTEDKEGVNFMIDLCVACITREIQIIGQEIDPSSLNLRKR
jgi:hypothetical protein